MSEPVLATARLDPGDVSNPHRVPLLLRVLGGLRFIRGNALPYFTLSAETHRAGFPNQCQGGGADHALILRKFPRFADLAALHLADLDGVPLHAEGNGWYWLAGAAGAAGGLGERFHGGNGHSAKSADDCLEVFAKHLRVSLDDARAILAHVLAAQPVITRVDGEPRVLKTQAVARREAFRAVIEAQRPRWKAEADACIAAHGLVVFGDRWPGREVAAA